MQVHQFLSEDNSGLDVLVNYLLFSHSLMKLEEHEQEVAKSKEQSDKLNDSTTTFKGRSAQVLIFYFFFLFFIKNLMICLFFALCVGW